MQICLELRGLTGPDHLTANQMDGNFVTQSG